MKSRPVAAVLALTLAGALLVGCGQPSSPAPTWKEVAVAEVEADAQVQIAKAEAAREELLHDMFELFGRVLGGETEQPHLEICGPEAKAIAQRVSADKGVKIGRTSWRLRNPDNVPPTWAETYVADQVEDARYVRHDDGRLAALFPIRMQTSCVTCHGDAATMDEGIKALLAESYPEDQATGFVYPGLRGYVWVEVPAGNS